MQESILLIGFGAIGLEITKRLVDDPQVRIAQILVRPGKEAMLKEAMLRGEIDNGVRIISSIEELDPIPDCVLECASHAAVAEFAPYFLSQGIDFGLISTGALSDPTLMQCLKIESKNGNSQLFVVPGAIGGVDALAAAGAENLDKVIYTSKKLPMSWTGTPADIEFDLSSIKEATIIFNGSARQAAKLYPKNANVAATIALAGLGFEDTKVTLVADPNAKGNTHHLEAFGSFGELDVTIIGNSLPSNPKSSALTAYSAVRALKNRTQHVCI
ncbi:MAG: aspartate dehydrogenase [Rhodospirillales bacterium]|jgi:aspartate dehydrogenase